MSICPHLDLCGNCPHMQASIEEQRNNRITWLRSFLQFPELELIPSPKTIGYRARISLRPNKSGELGYFQPKSHNHVPIASCVIAHKSINDALASLPPLPFAAKAVEFRSNGTDVLLNIFSQKGRRPTKKQLQDWNQGVVQGIGVDGQKMIGASQLRFDILGVEHRISLHSFYQVNLELNQILVQTIVDWIKEHKPTKVLDLYCGVGNIGAAIAKENIPVFGIDSAPSSIADGKQTIKRNTLPMEIKKANADQFQAGDAFFDVAVLDPPRKGASGVISELRYTNPKAIIYVSCNPHALRKDLFEAKKYGYTPSRMLAFEMFPHTNHIETLVELRKA